MNKIFLFLAATLFLAACSNTENNSDAFGNFEVDKTIISAEAQGKLLSFSIEEGDMLQAGEVVGQIDTINLFYKKEQLSAQLASVKSNFANIDAQAAVVLQQKENLATNQKRVHHLFKSKAATQKQVDDIDGQIVLVQKQVEAINTQKLALQNQIKVIDNQIKAIDYALEKSSIVNPINGRVLAKLTMANEVVAPGKPLYTIADMNQLKLKVYVSGNQLLKVKLGSEATVLIDGENGELKKLKGKIVWISNSAEFTPKNIQT
ncbi:MAG: HlyD family secretion protein, partial [Bacteroidetes bacterium]